MQKLYNKAISFSECYQRESDQLQTKLLQKPSRSHFNAEIRAGAVIKL